ncbi:HTH domain-containing protein [Natronomonas gomsonensis]|uniref:HTH domain-containing protein n=1 Tax=Natronomonas gomsonensis TaxID=1046043 RepID=UPI0015BBBD88|nr:HTH domain-containing protein [Natronomonas gomsonensis]
MLRGLDTWGENDDEPMIIKAAGREAFDGDVTVYVAESLSSESHERFRAVRDGFDRLEAAEVVDGVSVVTWPTEVDAPTDGPENEVVATYDEFVESVGTDALEPFFEAETGADDHERTVTMPDICITVRDEGELTGLYPKRDGSATQSVEDCLAALAMGDRVENVA